MKLMGWYGSISVNLFWPLFSIATAFGWRRPDYSGTTGEGRVRCVVNDLDDAPTTEHRARRI